MPLPWMESRPRPPLPELTSALRRVCTVEGVESFLFLVLWRPLAVSAKPQRQPEMGGVDPHWSCPSGKETTRAKDEEVDVNGAGAELLLHLLLNHWMYIDSFAVFLNGGFSYFNIAF